MGAALNDQQLHPPDLPAPPPKRDLRRSPAIYFAIAYFALCVWSIGREVSTSAVSGRHSLSPIAVLAVAYLAVFFLLGIHEIGHAAFGRLVGFRCLELVIGPAHLSFTRNGLVWRLNRQWWLPIAWASSAPQDYRFLRLRTAVFVAGGPATNGLFWGVVTLAFSAMGLSHPASPSFASTLTCLAGISGFIAVINLFPIDFNRGLVFDGARLTMLALFRRKANRFCAVLALTGADHDGKRPREWDPSLVCADDTLDDCHVDLSAESWYGYHYFLDQGDAYAAGDRLWTAIAVQTKLTDRISSEAACEAAYYCASFTNQLPTARAYLEHVNRKQCHPALWKRAEAAIFFAEGKTAEAVQACNDGLDAFTTRFLTGIQLAGRDWLMEIRERAVRA